MLPGREFIGEGELRGKTAFNGRSQSGPKEFKPRFEIPGVFEVFDEPDERATVVQQHLSRNVRFAVALEPNLETIAFGHARTNGAGQRRHEPVRGVIASETVDFTTDFQVAKPWRVAVHTRNPIRLIRGSAAGSCSRNGGFDPERVHVVPTDPRAFNGELVT